jgi:tetratricopeptide (TPR) repeat protein
LHRDIKPSNVLVTGDGLPMLLDFNLAREPWIDGAAVPPEALGGTFAYMAPEHLEALAIGDDDRVDRRSDLFSLGVLLYEALTGSRPFPACPGGSSMAEALQRAAESRRGAPPRLRTDHPEIPGAFERVIRRCLDPDPTRRHPTALELASDLQAVADDAPLPSTREPLALRALRRARRSWKRLALVIPLATAVVLGALALVRAGNERLQLDEKAARLLLEGNQALDRGDSSAALVHFATLESLTEGRSDLEPLHRQAARQRIWTLRSRAMRSSAETFLRASATLRDQMLDGRASPEVIRDGLNRALRPFDVASDPAWSRRPDLGLLDPQSRERLVQDIDELLFVHAVHLDPRDPAQNQEARQILGRALGSTRLSEPWLALGGRLSGTQTLAAKQDPRKEGSARLCFAWGVLRDREGQTPSAIAWLERACVLAPGSAWYRRYLADVHERAGAPSEALRHLEAAVAADPGSKAALLARARVLRTLGETAQARDDEERARLAGVLESRPAK